MHVLRPSVERAQSLHVWVWVSEDTTNHRRAEEPNESTDLASDSAERSLLARELLASVPKEEG